MKKSLIYTKGGDKGTTSLVGGTRVPKTHIRLESYGTIDELNSHIGWLICAIEEPESVDILSFIQNRLFDIGSNLATETESMPPREKPLVTEESIQMIEHEIDRLDAELPPLKRFILPGGSEVGARAHICRTICRRAERNVYRVADEYPVDQSVLSYLNRLSDYFFVLARRESNKRGKEIYWEQHIS
ncbi:MAG: cob(I)yrinic acid a,c-diamide adenosyltransferase [Dysgonamonadaceae bacterium]